MTHSLESPLQQTHSLEWPIHSNDPFTWITHSRAEVKCVYLSYQNNTIWSYQASDVMNERRYQMNISQYAKSWTWHKISSI